MLGVAQAQARPTRVDAALEAVREVLRDATTDTCDGVWLRNNTAWAFLQVAARDAGLRQEALASAEVLLSGSGHSATTTVGTPRASSARASPTTPSLVSF